MNKKRIRKMITENGFHIPKTTKRVELNTDAQINERIRNNTIDCLKDLKHSSDNKLAARINQLNYEWDTERVLQANAAAIVLLSSLAGLRHGRHWFLISGAAGGFLLQHAVQGWCPPVPLIRKAGVRTPEEITHEKMVLKILRGDFQHMRHSVSKMLKAVEKQ